VLVQHRGAGRCNQLGQSVVGGLLALVDPFQVRNQLGGHPTSDHAGGIAGTHLR
jgi:hypothetical protein